MSDRQNNRTLMLVARSAILTAVLVILGLRLERSLGGREAEMLDRAPGAAPLQKVSERPESLAAGQTIFVPVYSHIYSTGGAELLLEATLTIRNTDPAVPILVDSVRYYDPSGHMVREYLDQPVSLGPLASSDFLVEKRDRTGGLGANFLVEWVAEEAANEPMIEAVMVGSEGNQAISFVRSGRPITGGDEGE